jgi:hypothetical protein
MLIADQLRSVLRGVATFGLVAFVVVACSSSDEAQCQVAGLYVATATPESGNCPVSTDPVTDTFEVKGDSATLIVQGLGPVCTGKVQSCTWTASCPIVVTDATDPANKTGTVQYSWTFTKDGFSGTSALSLPPAKSLPSGCKGIARVTGSRR